MMNCVDSLLLPGDVSYGASFYEIVKRLGDKNSINPDAAFVDLPMASRLFFLRFGDDKFAHISLESISKISIFSFRLYSGISTSALAPSTSTLFYECVKAPSEIGNEIF